MVLASGCRVTPVRVRAQFGWSSLIVMFCSAPAPVLVIVIVKVAGSVEVRDWVSRVPS